MCLSFSCVSEVSSYFSFHVCAWSYLLVTCRLSYALNHLLIIFSVFLFACYFIVSPIETDSQWNKETTNLWLLINVCKLFPFPAFPSSYASSESSDLISLPPTCCLNSFNLVSFHLTVLITFSSLSGYHQNPYSQASPHFTSLKFTLRSNSPL